jgi:protein-L-isoaspartate(D-aspartate) O-methyltransferase
MTDSYEKGREKMVEEQLVARGINDSRVLAAMRKVARHLFVTKELRQQAYEDKPLPIGHDQTISQPYMVALMAEAAELKGHERVMEIGTGSGYEAAILAELCGQLFSVERVEALARKARALLADLGYMNISIQVGDGTLGWNEYAPYDVIVVSAAAPQIPRPLIEQLKPEGILILPMGEEDLQSLVRIRQRKEGLKEEYLGECRFVKLRGEYGWEN